MTSRRADGSRAASRPSYSTEQTATISRTRALYHVARGRGCPMPSRYPRRVPRSRSCRPVVSRSAARAGSRDRDPRGGVLVRARRPRTGADPAARDRVPAAICAAGPRRPGAVTSDFRRETPVGPLDATARAAEPSARLGRAPASVPSPASGTADRIVCSDGCRAARCAGRGAPGTIDESADATVVVALRAATGRGGRYGGSGATGS